MLPVATLEEEGFHVLDAGLNAPSDDKYARTWFVVASKRQAYVYRRAENVDLVLIAHAEDHTNRMMPFDYHVIRSKTMYAHFKHDEFGYYDTTFVHRIAAWLEIAWREKAFDRLVLVAASDTLENIRSSLSEN